MQRAVSCTVPGRCRSSCPALHCLCHSLILGVLRERKLLDAVITPLPLGMGMYWKSYLKTCIQKRFFSHSGNCVVKPVTKNGVNQHASLVSNLPIIILSEKDELNPTVDDLKSWGLREKKRHTMPSCGKIILRNTCLASDMYRSIIPMRNIRKMKYYKTILNCT